MSSGIVSSTSKSESVLECSDSDVVVGIDEEDEAEYSVGAGMDSGVLSANNEDSEGEKVNGEKRLDAASEPVGELDHIELIPTLLLGLILTPGSPGI